MPAHRNLLGFLTRRGDGDGPPLSARAYLLAWRGLRALPASQAYLLGAVAADLTYRRNGVGVRRLRANLQAIGVQRGAVPHVSRAAVRSYLRYWVEVFRLPSWSTEQILASVRPIGDEPVREALAEGRGVVMALAHQGNWDLAGAWSTHALAHVTTVAERLEPPEVYEQFVRFREELGMTIHGVGEPSLLRSLVTALENGQIVPLLADRDLTGAGVKVDFAGHPCKIGPGPALLADLTGAALFPVSIAYEMVRVDDDGWPESGWQTVIRFHSEVKMPTGGSRGDRVQAAAQACADALASGVQANPADWHMLQPVFDDVAYPAPKSPENKSAPAGRFTAKKTRLRRNAR